MAGDREWGDSELGDTVVVGLRDVGGLLEVGGERFVGGEVGRAACTGGALMAVNLDGAATATAAEGFDGIVVEDVEALDVGSKPP